MLTCPCVFPLATIPLPGVRYAPDCYTCASYISSIIIASRKSPSINLTMRLQHSKRRKKMEDIQSIVLPIFILVIAMRYQSCSLELFPALQLRSYSRASVKALEKSSQTVFMTLSVYLLLVCSAVCAVTDIAGVGTFSAGMSAPLSAFDHLWGRVRVSTVVEKPIRTPSLK